MTRIYVARDGDRIDQIVFEHYGTLDVMTQVFDANPGIAALLDIPMGTELVLPDIDSAEIEQSTKLWTGAK